jgi:hypothetical protein
MRIWRARSQRYFFSGEGDLLLDTGMALSYNA